MKKFIMIILMAQMAGLTGCASTSGRSRTNYNSQPQQSQSSAQNEYTKKIIKEGLLGAATGAIAAEASGGKAGKGALIGAGANILGGVLFDVLTKKQTQSQQPQYAPYVDQWNQENPSNKKIIRKYDADGNMVSEEVFEG